jgi:hypothetical protein
MEKVKNVALMLQFLKTATYFCILLRCTSHLNKHLEWRNIINCITWQIIMHVNELLIESDRWQTNWQREDLIFCFSLLISWSHACMVIAIHIHPFLLHESFPWHVRNLGIFMLLTLKITPRQHTSEGFGRPRGLTRPATQQETQRNRPNRLRDRYRADVKLVLAWNGSRTAPGRIHRGEAHGGSPKTSKAA